MDSDEVPPLFAIGKRRPRHFATDQGREWLRSIGGEWIAFEPVVWDDALSDDSIRTLGTIAIAFEGREYVAVVTKFMQFADPGVSVAVDDGGTNYSFSCRPDRVTASPFGPKSPQVEAAVREAVRKKLIPFE